jgi:peptidoglycan/LPS O-acetylase OafA/YrhL
MPGLDWMTLTVLSTALVLPIAFLSWVLVERPALMMKSVVSGRPDGFDDVIVEAKTDERAAEPAGRVYARPLRSGW